MDKRAILAIILTFAIIVVWGVFQQKLTPPAPVKEPSKTAAAPEEKKAEAKPEALQPAAAGKQAALPRVTVKKEVTVETLQIRAVLTSEDARVKHFRLKQYKDRVEESSITLKLLGFYHSIVGGKVSEPPKPVDFDIVNTEEQDGLPLGLVFADGQTGQADGFWEVDKESLQLLKPGDKGEIAFTKTFDNGMKVVKRYRFEADKDSVDVDVEVQNPTAQEIKTQVGLEWVGRVELKKNADEGNRDFGLKYSYLKNGKVEVKDLAGAGSAGGCVPGCSTPKLHIDPIDFSDKGDLGWFSFGGEYFTALMIPPAGEKNAAIAVKSLSERNLVRASIMASPIAVAPGQSATVPFKAYMGPKDGGRLKALGVNAEKLIDFGYFDIVAKPLLWVMNFTNKATGNFGIDIIIISILIKIIFLPLTQISFKSMKEMQKVQPEMARLKETYKNDKAKLQQETMLLYKRRKINPMSGCLPMAVQIPVFIALYNALQNTLEMRHAPFFLWIQDLAAKDPIYITPIVMGATMVIQQKMTPSSADPAQAKLFLLMPVMFTFMFLSFPSGLVIYWMVNNILSIAHQYYLNKKP
jgi:YidC/Oxa1 family membrane protein insertase